DYTLFAKVDGVVTFENFGKNRKRVSVYPSAESCSCSCSCAQAQQQTQEQCGADC
ncbi:MAG: hypothetical protein D3914_13025, partial [Candidatus Electrothrix sp. LOE2]|nr:hypothetical protein [Candidatus Electrothrix sp. LOE2]